MVATVGQKNEQTDKSMEELNRKLNCKLEFDIQKIKMTSRVKNFLIQKL
jgi:hypothetical protein